jgi:hypothetical protein
MEDTVLETIRKERAAIEARLSELETEAEGLRRRLESLGEAEAALLGDRRIGKRSNEGKAPARARGGEARARSLSPERRAEIARLGAAARWTKESE